MNSISNVWNHPKTSAAGVMIAIATVAGVLGQQGVSLGRAGSGTVVALAGAIATALLGLLARDPAQPQAAASGTTARLGAWALIATLLPLPFLAGCSGTSVAQDIVNWTPALESAVATVDSTAALLAPADAPFFAAATVGFDAASNLVAGQARAYLANPTAGVLAQIQDQIVALQQQVNAAVLQAARIVDPASQKHALAAIQGVAIIVSAILAAVQSVSGKAAIARMAAQSPLKLAEVEPHLDHLQTARAVAAHYSEPVALAEDQMAQVQDRLRLAGF